MNGTTLIHIGAWMVFGAALPGLAGCGLSPDGEGDGALGEARQADLSRNDLSRNSLSFNDLSRNDLSRNALAASTLSSNALSTAGLGVQLLKYVIRCALPDEVCLDVPVTATDTDVPSECVNGVCHFCGNLNLAPDWQTTPLTIAKEKWISACLLAHVNIDGVSIPISVRDDVGGNIAVVQAAEYTLYNSPEAAFYGNLFRPGPNGQYEKYVCNAGSSLTPPGRVCGLDAAGATECAMTFTGSCAGHAIGAWGNDDSAVCGHVGSLPNGAVRLCGTPLGGSWTEVLTIYDAQLCGDGLCSGSETTSNCPQDCQLHHWHDDDD